MSTRWARNFFGRLLGRLLGLKFVRALNNYSKWRRFWTSPVQVTKNLESSRLACTGIPSTTGSPKITKRSPNVERNNIIYVLRFTYETFGYQAWKKYSIYQSNSNFQSKKIVKPLLPLGRWTSIRIWIENISEHNEQLTFRADGWVSKWLPRSRTLQAHWTSDMKSL